MSETVIECEGPEDVARLIMSRSQMYPEAYEQALWEEANITMNMSKAQCPVDTGRLRATGGVELTSPTSAELYYCTKYAVYVHENVGGYWIHPKTAKMLRFEVDGKIVYAHKVWMPPNPNAKFLENPVNQRVDSFPAGLLKRAEDYIGGVA